MSRWMKVGGVAAGIFVLAFGGLFVILGLPFARLLMNDSPPAATTTSYVNPSGASLPLDAGSRISYGGAFNDPNYPSVKPHNGEDLNLGSASRTLGKPVFAAFSGTVVSSGIGKGCKKGAAGNNLVMIKTAAGFEIGYMHMNGDKILVRVGDIVEAGQQIGSIGSCGQSTGPHVHFEVTPGTDSDPWLLSIPWVEKYGKRWLDPTAFMAHFGIKL